MGASGTTNLETGLYAFNASTMVVPATSAAIPTDGTWYTSPWITDSAQQFKASTEHLLTAGYDTGTGSAVSGIPRGAGFCFHLGGDPATTNGYTSGAATLISATIFEWAIEYESTEIDRVILVLGDSITQAVGQSSSTVTTGQPRYRAWPDLWALRNRTAVVSIGISGSMTGDWITDNTARWLRYDAAGMTFDAAILALGANDLNAATPVALTGYQANVTTVLGILKARIGDGKPIYMSNVTPRGLDNTTLYSGVTREALRGQYNRWIGLGVRYVRGVLDMDKVVRDPATPSQITAVYNADGATTQAHMSREGYFAMALSVGVL
jgi:lysophospholipase L1-like esterase